MTQNRLAQSQSAYLKSAAHQPIDWYEFGDEAFEAAKSQDKLILLDIGAVWCHWCHVIDRESYENQDIAALVNEKYIAVKVDRDQRPDIDARYQQIVASMTGQGGWPLTAVLTYDGRVLFGGTYFPPETMKSMLPRLTDLYYERKDEILADSLDKASPEVIDANLDAAEQEEASKSIPDDVFERLIHNASHAYDQENGGFGSKPKFPHFSALEYLIQQAVAGGERRVIPVIEHTLVAMAQGGTYDQLGGGLHRYSVDAHWHVPHFEKMAYDNAEALTVYAQAYRLTENPALLQAINGILRFVGEVLSNPNTGGFYASQDADIDLEDDGDYFTWTHDELAAELSHVEFDIVEAAFAVTSEGNMHGRPGRTVLRQAMPVEALAEKFQMPADALSEKLESARTRLLEKRRTRQTPYVDTSIYLNWNGMMLCGYFQVADLLDKPNVRDFAQKTLDTLLETHTDKAKDVLLHSAGIEGFLEDYAWFIAALVQGYYATENRVYLDAALHWADRAVELFEDTRYGGFYDVPTPPESALALLKFRRKPGEDTPSSSANAVMLRQLNSLSLLMDKPVYREKAERGIRMFGQALSSQGMYACAMATAWFEINTPPARLQVLGDDNELKAAARKAFYPGKQIYYGPLPDETEEPETAEIRICVGTRCLPPVKDSQTLNETLSGLAAVKV